MRAWMRRHPKSVTAIGMTAVLAALAFALHKDRHEFVAALGAAPLWILGIAAAMHVLWLVARSEAWSVCIDAAGGSVGRRRLFHASSLGYVASMFNGQFGLAVRIAALRRSAPHDAPRPSVLVAAELPVVAVEVALAAICSFTLVGPLGLPWWTPVVAFAATGAIFFGLQRLARHRREGFWSGLAVLRGLRGRSRIIALVCVAVVLQIGRNWLLLNWSGVDASVLDATALLIGLAFLGLMPVGPALGATAAVLILGSNGVAATAAVGTMLTLTAAVGAVCFAAWALVDRMWRPHMAGQPLPG